MALRDPRQAWKVVCPLPEILLLVLGTTLAGADHLLAVQSTWPSLHAGIVGDFEGIPMAAPDRWETTDGDHGRISIRRH